MCGSWGSVLVSHGGELGLTQTSETIWCTLPVARRGGRGGTAVEVAGMAGRPAAGQSAGYTIPITGGPPPGACQVKGDASAHHWLAILHPLPFAYQ